MCGICGILHFDGQPVEAEWLENMLRSLRHRGPDGTGMHLWRDSRLALGLGHSRLKVIDLMGSDQPLSNEDGSVWVTFNGEIYNFRALRKNLEEKHQFRFQGDTEVLVHLYEDKGKNFLQNIEGMFAFAIWDQRRRRLLLVRDRVGKKPLYYFRDANYFLFASEIKALRHYPFFNPRFSQRALPYYLQYGYVPSPQTFFENVQQLDPGCWLEIDDTGQITTGRYWDLRFRPEGSLAEETRTLSRPLLLGRLRQEIRQAVSKRLESDVPLGAFLSGGIDSSVVVAEMAHIQKEPVKTFSIGFSGQGIYDETPFAEQVARRFGTDHQTINVAPKAMDLVEDLLNFHDQPFGDSSAIPTFILCREVRKHVTVALSGDGGDEIFAGYERFRAVPWAHRIPGFARWFGVQILNSLPRGQYHSLRAKAFRFLKHSNGNVEDVIMNFCKFFQIEELVKVLTEKGVSPTDTTAFYRERAAQSDADSVLRKILYLNFVTYLPEDLLVKMDRMSMANSLEVRSPFLDHHLVQFVAGLSDEIKLKGFTLKSGLKGAYRDVLPANILHRKKRGFAVPLGNWFRGELRGVVEEHLLGQGVRVSEWIRPVEIERLCRLHQDKTRDASQQIWLLLMLELWLRQNA